MADGVYNIRKTTNIKKSVSIKFIVVSFFLVVFFVLLFSGILGIFFFKVNNIKITGNIYYDAETIIQKSGIEKNSAIFTVNKTKAEENIRESLPYIADVKVKIIFPGSVKIDVVNDVGVYKLKTGGEYYIISKDFKVLCKEKDIRRRNVGEDEAQYETNIISVKTNAVVKCFVGTEIKFSDVDIKDILMLFYDSFIENEIFDYINEINISDKFDIFLFYDDRFRIEYGNFEDVGIKTAFAHNYIQTLYEEDMGIIDVRDKKEGLFIYTQNIY